MGDIADKNFLVVPDFPSSTATYDVTLYYSAESLAPWINEDNGGCDPMDNLRVISSAGSIAGASSSYQVASPNNSLTYNDTDYEFTGSFIGDLGGFAIADLKVSSQLFVHQNNGDDTNNGSDWNNSYATLQAAIDAIGAGTCPSGYEIRIAKGIYYPCLLYTSPSPRDS